MMKMMKMRATPFLVVAFLLATVFSCKKDDNSNNDDSGSGSGDDGQTQTEVQVAAEYTNGGTSGAMYKHKDITLKDGSLTDDKTVDSLGESHYIKVHIVLSNTEEGQAYQYSYKLDDPSYEDYGLFNRLTEEKPLSKDEFYDVPPSGEFDLYFFGNRVSDVTARLTFIKADDPDEVVVASTQEPLKFHISEQGPVLNFTGKAPAQAFYVKDADGSGDIKPAEVATAGALNWLPNDTPDDNVDNDGVGGTLTISAEDDKYVYGSFRFIPQISADAPTADNKVGDPTLYSISYSLADKGNPGEVDYTMCRLDDNKLVDAASGATLAAVENATTIVENDFQPMVATKVADGSLIWGFKQAASSTEDNPIAKYWLFRLNNDVDSEASIQFDFKLLAHITEDHEKNPIDAYIQSEKTYTVTIEGGVKNLPSVN